MQYRSNPTYKALCGRLDSLHAGAYRPGSPFLPTSFHWFFTVVAVLWVLMQVPAFAAEHTWSVLHKAQQASQRLTYQGVLSVQSGRHMQSSRVTHYWDAQQGELEAVETLQGQPVEWIRHNDDVQCVMHDSKTIRMDKRHAQRVFSGLLAARVEDVAEHYTIAQKESERTVGLETVVYELRPRDRMRYGYRMWIDRDSHLLVRSQTLGDNDEVIEQVGFSELRIGPLPEKLRPRFKPVGEGWKVDETGADRSEPPALQVSFKPGVPGFKQMSGMARRNRQAIVNQYVYTDGLASVSIFVEPYDARKPQANAVIHHGAVRSMVKRVGDHSVTVMGEVPLITIKQFIHDIDIRKP